MYLVMLVCASIDVFGDILLLILLNLVILIFHFRWLVGAFSVFGRADTGKPVQILGDFAILLLSLEI